MYFLFVLFLSVIWLDIYHDFVNKRRISAFACQNGYLKIAVVNEENANGMVCFLIRV